LASLGFKMGGAAAYGLQRLVVDEHSHPKGFLKRGERKFLITDRVRLGPGTSDQVKVVKWIFEQYLQERSQASVARELNRRGILTNRGEPWRKGSVGALLRNEAYIGNFIYNRDTEKLGSKRTRNPKDRWVRCVGAIELIIEPEIFLRTKKTMDERRICISDEEMLIRLRKLLAKKGKLSATTIDASPNVPSVSAYLRHFGTLRNIYRLIGYTANQNYWDELAAHKRWVDLLLENAERLREAFEKAGKHATLDASPECLRINNTVNISFRVAKWREHKRRPIRWTLRRRARWPKGWVVALRLGENSATIWDYVLLPSASLSFTGPLFWFSEETRAAHNSNDLRVLRSCLNR
jgi:hypothetical protein